MYKQYNRENNIITFSITTLFFQKLAGNKLFLNGKLIENNTSCLGYFIDENLFCYSNDNDFHSKILNIKDNSQIDIGVVNIQSFSIDGLFLSYSFDKDFNSEVVWLDSQSFKEKIKSGIKNLTFSYFFKKYGLNKTDVDLSLYELPNCRLLWKSNVNIIFIIGIHSDILWIFDASQLIIGIDVRSGELIYKTDLLKEFNFDGNAIDEFAYGDIHLDSAYGILRSISNRYYWELDLNTFKATIKKDFGDLSDSWRIRRSKFYEGDSNLYFIGARHGEAVNRAVGIFDTNKCEVTWYDEPLEERKFLFFTDVPQVNDKYLGVLDSENNLRLYERE